MSEYSKILVNKKQLTSFAAYSQQDTFFLSEPHFYSGITPFPRQLMWLRKNVPIS